MFIASLISFASMLAGKLRSAPADVRAAALESIRDAQDSGLLPLGMRKDGGTATYVWFLFDRTRLTLAERERYVRERTPPGVPSRVIEA